MHTRGKVSAKSSANLEEITLTSVEVPWGREEALEVKLPPDWHLIAEGQFDTPPAMDDLSGALRKALDAPILSPPLREMVGPESRIALVMDDESRPTPVDRLAPLLLKCLLEAGAQPENITGLFAPGTHEPMTRAQMRARAGGYVFSTIDCRCCDCHEEESLVFLGQTERGTPVWLNRIAAQADLRILIGTIEPHPQAGFGGGFKNLLPGLAGAESIGHNHLLMPSPDRYNMIGTLPEGNPMRQDLEEAGRILSGPTFIVNVVLDPALEPVAVVCGDAIAAHGAGVEIARSIYGVRLTHQADVVVTNAYPMDQDLRQAGKAILNAAGACKPGGLIIGFLRCEDGLRNVDLPPFVPPLGAARALAKVLGSRGISLLSQHLPARVPVEDRFLVNFALQMLKDYHVLIFSPRLKQDSQGRFPPVLYDDQELLFEEAARLLARADAEVAVFTHGGISFPIVGAG